MANDPTAFNNIVSQIQNNQITTVDLNNAGITDTDCVPLANALKNSTSLQVLYLINNSIGDSGASSLANVLRNSTSVTALHLQNNSIGYIGASNLASALLVNSVLIELRLGGNSIGDSGASSFVSALQINTALQILGLGSNSIGDSGACSLAGALQVNTALQQLVLEINPIGDSGYGVLLQALTHNYKLTAFSFNSNIYMTQINALLSRNQQCAGQISPGLQCPLLRFNPLILHKGERLILTPADLQMTNMSYVRLNGNFTISNITNCQFLNAESESITEFSQIDINNGTISLQHDGSDIAPSFNVTASYNDLETWPIPAAVNFTSSTMPSTRTTISRSFTTTSQFSSTTLLPFTSTTLYPTTTAVAANSAASSSSSVVPLVAGIAGAAAGVAAMAAGVVWFRRRRRQQVMVLPTNTLAMLQNPDYLDAASVSTSRDWDPATYATNGQPSASLRRDAQAVPAAWDPNLYTTAQPASVATANTWDRTKYDTARRVPKVDIFAPYETADDEFA